MLSQRLLAGPVGELVFSWCADTAHTPRVPDICPQLLPVIRPPPFLLVSQAQLAGGEYDPTSTKVLHFVSNPAAEVARLRQAAELDRLAAENEELRAALTRAGAAGTCVCVCAGWHAETLLLHPSGAAKEVRGVMTIVLTRRCAADATPAAACVVRHRCRPATSRCHHQRSSSSSHCCSRWPG